MKDWIEILIRSVALFFITFAFIRIMGKRQLTRMTPFQFINYSVIAILIALMTTNLIENLAFGFIALGIWFLFPIALDYASMKSKWIHDFVYGKETILVKHGKIMEESLSQLRLTGEELLKELRSKNAFNLADVEFAIMESTGEINLLLKSDKTPITPHDLGTTVSPKNPPQTVILDGAILDEPLSNMGLNRGWLKVELENMEVSVDNVFIGQVDSFGDLYVDLFDDSVQLPEAKVKELLYATLEKIQADLSSFALDTDNSKAKAMYSKNAHVFQDMIKKLEPYLLR